MSATGDAEPAAPALQDAGAARNTVLQMASQLANLVFTGGLSLFLVRALGPSHFGVYSLAISVAGLVVIPAGLGVPTAIGRFIADRQTDRSQLRETFWLGMRLQLPAAVIAAVGLFATSGLIAAAYHRPGLAWPLRLAALSVAGQVLFAFLATVVTALRQGHVALQLNIVEGALETSGSVVLVIAGGGAAGAVGGRLVGYTVAAVIGLWLTVRLIGRRERRRVRDAVTGRTLLSYAATMLLVDVTWSAISQLDIVLVGAVLSPVALGSYGAVLRALTVVSYLGTAVGAAVGPRVSQGGGKPDVQAFERGLRYLILVQGLTLAPLIIWAQPISELVLGSRYTQAPAIMRVITFYYFAGAPASLLTLALSYLGQARRRVTIMLPTLAFGVVAIFVLLETIGLLGAALGDDLLQIVYVGGNVWLCGKFIDFDLRALSRTTLRTIAAAGGMAVVLWVLGTHHLSVVQWVIGAIAGTVEFVAVLLLTRETSPREMAGLVVDARHALFGR